MRPSEPSEGGRPADPSSPSESELPRPSSRPSGQAGSAPKEQLRTSYRILLHIARQGRVGPTEIPPYGLSQAGMVEALGITQGALTGVLARLVAAGILSVEKSHVLGHDRRVKVYLLTPRGETLVRDLRRRQSEAMPPTRVTPGPAPPGFPSSSPA